MSCILSSTPAFFQNLLANSSYLLVTSQAITWQSGSLKGMDSSIYLYLYFNDLFEYFLNGCNWYSMALTVYLLSEKARAEASALAPVNTPISKIFFACLERIIPALRAKHSGAPIILASLNVANVSFNSSCCTGCAGVVLDKVYCKTLLSAFPE